MKSISRLLGLLLCLAIMFSMAACGKDTGGTPAGGDPGKIETPSGNAPDQSGTNADGVTSSRDTLRVMASGDNGTLDPVGMSDDWYFIAPVYMETLWDTNENFETVWRLATSYDVISPTNIIVHLREGVTFSNGNPFNVDDVLFSLTLWRDTPSRWFVVRTVDFEKTAAIDEFTLDLYFNEAPVNFGLGVSVCDAESYDPVEATMKPVGTGPYVVEEYLVNSHVHFVAREDYWGQKPIIKNIQFKVINEAAQQVNALVTGTVDVSVVPTYDIEYVKTLPGYDVKVDFNAHCSYIMFNLDKSSISSNLDARYAVCYAVDRNAVASLVYNGYAEVTNIPVTMATTDYEPRLANLHDTYSKGYNPELARKYAESSGLIDSGIRIMTNGSAEYTALAELIQNSLKEIGVTAEIISADQITFFMAFGEDPESADIWLYETITGDRTSYTALTTAAMCAILIADDSWPGVARYDELRIQYPFLNEQERRDALYEMVQVFTEGCPWFGLCDLMRATAFPNDLRGVEFSVLGSLYYNYLWFE